MRRIPYRSSLILVITLLALLAAPDRITHTLRAGVVAVLSPCWRALASVSHRLLHPLASSSERASHAALESELGRIRAENRVLREELLRSISLDRLKDGLLFHLERLHWSDAWLREEADACYHRRCDEMVKLIRDELEALPASVVFREPASWNTTLWIGVGKADNRRRGREIVARNSPVLVGDSLVGVVEYVGSHHSRVRLISDSSLRVAVRAVRGGVVQHRLFTLIGELQESLALSGSAAPAGLFEGLEEYRQQIDPSGPSLYMAKGEISGSGESSWRSCGRRLQGIGFQYDYEDAEGPARDLRTGAVQGSSSGSGVPLLEEGDLLITTGYDGIFPSGLLVAVVDTIAPLREGAYYYELEARPSVGSLDEIEAVLVLPPTGFHDGTTHPLK